jgi:hypothetical protein
MEPKKKYLLVMDLDDADHDLREAEREYNEIDKERETLVRWSNSREIPSELLEEIEYRRENVLQLEDEVKRLQERIKNFDESVKPELKMPDELKELKLRLRLELDSNITNRVMDVTDRVMDEWYEEYQYKYNHSMELQRRARDSAQKDAADWSNWALQNIS